MSPIAQDAVIQLAEYGWSRRDARRNGQHARYQIAHRAFFETRDEAAALLAIRGPR